jgi:osmotically-inducible protein OsmY
MRSLLLAFALIATIAGSGGAATVAKTTTSSAAKKQTPPRGLSDAAIEAAIKAKLAKSKIGADHLTVKVHNGIAVWEGKTDVIQHKGAATRMAKAAGATAVVNNIQISEAARKKAADRLAGIAAGTPVPRAQVKTASPGK